MPDDDEKYAHISSNHFDRNAHSVSANGPLLGGLKKYPDMKIFQSILEQKLGSRSSHAGQQPACASRSAWQHPVLPIGYLLGNSVPPGNNQKRAYQWPKNRGKNRAHQEPRRFLLSLFLSFLFQMSKYMYS